MKYVYVTFTWDEPDDGLSFEISGAYDNLAAADDWARARAEAMVEDPSEITKRTEKHWPTQYEQHVYEDPEYQLAGYIIMEVES